MVMRYFAYYLMVSWSTVLLAALFLLPDEFFAIGFVAGVAVMAYMLYKKAKKILDRKRNS